MCIFRKKKKPSDFSIFFSYLLSLSWCKAKWSRTTCMTCIEQRLSWPLVRIPQPIHHKGMNAIFSRNTRVLFPPSFPHARRPVPWPPRARWCSLGDTFSEAADGSSSLPFFSPPFHSVLVCTRPSNLCAAPLLSETANHVVPSSYNGNIYLGEMVVQKSISNFCNVFCSSVTMLRFSLPSWPVTKKKECLGEGNACGQAVKDTCQLTVKNAARPRSRHWAPHSL